MTNKDRKNKVIQRQGNRRQKNIRDRSNKRQGNRGKDRMKKTKLGILYWKNGANKPYKLKKAFKTKRICKFPFTISCHSLKGISVFTPLPTGERHFYVFYYLCHYDFCPLCHYGFCIILSVIMTSVHYVIMASASFCLSLWLLSFMSLRLLHHSVYHFGFCPLCHYVFCSPVTLSFTYSIHYVFRSFCLV